MSDWLLIPLAVVASIAVLWLVLALALWWAKPADAHLKDYLRLMPDLLRLLKGLATDPDVPTWVRVALVVMLAFIASPIDLIPDVVPVIGFADDLILVGLALRCVVKTAGRPALARHWPGTADGLEAVCRVFGARTER